jgi:hypothetical protein
MITPILMAVLNGVFAVVYPDYAIMFAFAAQGWLMSDYIVRSCDV